MSIELIKEKIFQSIKKELNTQENKEFIENDILKPLIQQILDQMYPYFMWMGLFFMSMFACYRLSHKALDRNIYLRILFWLYFLA